MNTATHAITFVELNNDDLYTVNGGFGWAAGIALGALFVAAYTAGYQWGKDLASR